MEVWVQRIRFFKNGFEKVSILKTFLQISKCYLFGCFGVCFSGVYLETKYLKTDFFSDCELKNVKYFFRWKLSGDDGQGV